MKDWKTLENNIRRAKTKREKRKVYFASMKYLEKASLPELKKIIGATENETVMEQAKIELWWRGINKKPANLLKLIRTSNDKNKIEYAITKLGDLKYKAAVNTLIGFLGDIDVRNSAAFALRQMPTQKAFGPLVQSIKKYPDGAECLLYALEVLDCSDAAELLIDLFVSNPDAIVVRDDIFVCFAKGAVKRIPKKVKETCCKKVLRAIEKSKDKSNTEELEQFYEVLTQIEEV